MNETPPNQYTPSAPKNLTQEEEALKIECQKILEGTGLPSIDKIWIHLDPAFKKHLKEFVKIEHHSIQEVEKLKKEIKAKIPKPGKK